MYDIIIVYMPESLFNAIVVYIVSDEINKKICKE